MGPAIRILATSHPEPMSSLVGVRAVGAPATAFAELLHDAEEVSASDVHEHEQLRTTSPAILGEDTRAVVIVPLQSDNEVIGFLRLDASRAGEIDRRAVERLHEMTPMASIALLLEQERVRSEAHVSRVHQLRKSMCRQTVRAREAGLELHQATQALHEMVESVAPKLEHAQRLELSAIIRRCAEHVEIAAGTLNDAETRGDIDNGRRVSVEPN